MGRCWTLKIAVMLIAAGLAHIGVVCAGEPASIVQREADVARMQAQLNAVPPGRLKTDSARQLMQQLAAAKAELERARRQTDGSRALPGEASRGDPILDNAAVRAFTTHKLLLETLADRAQAARRDYQTKLGLLDPSKLAPAGKTAADEAAQLAAQGERRLSAAMAERRPFDPDPEADYRAAIDAFSQAGTALTALLPAAPPTPAEVVAQIPRDGEHYLPTGTDLLAAGRAMRDRKVQLTAVITQMSAPFDPKGFTELITEDGKFRILLRWDACPDGLRQQFSMRSTGPRAMQKGTRLWIEGTVATFEGNDRCYVTPTECRRVDAGL